MARGITQIARLLRPLFGFGPTDTLSPPEASGTGGRGMGRRVVLFLLAAAVLAGAGYAAFRYFSPASPEHVEAPTFTPSGEPLPQTDDFARLAATDPVAMYEACLSRYAKEVKGYTATLDKQERVRGKLHDRELVRVAVWGEVPEQPGAEPKVKVRMIWDDGAQKDLLGNPVLGALYVAGENNNEMRTWRPSSFIKEMSIDPKATLTRDASRYCIKDGGIYRGMLRTYAAWKQRKEAGTLRAEYLGTRVIDRAGGRLCHVVRRTCASPEVDSFALDEAAPTDPKTAARDGATDITVMIDAERWIQVGTILKRVGGDLLAEYYFRDLELTATPLPPDTFTMDGLRAAIKKK